MTGFRRTPRVYVVGRRHHDRPAWARRVRARTRDPALPVCSHEYSKDLVYEYGAMRTITQDPSDWAWVDPDGPDPDGPASPVPTLDELADTLAPATPRVRACDDGAAGILAWMRAMLWLRMLGYGGLLAVTLAGLTLAVWAYAWVLYAYALYFMFMAYAIPAALFLALCMRTFAPVLFLVNLTIGALSLAAIPFGGLLILFPRKRDGT